MTLPNEQGFLIAFEGIDGAGKSTQATLVFERLTALGFEVVKSKEPTDGPHGRRLRESAQVGRLAPQEELEEFILDRKDHVRNVIRPALQRGQVVLLDRYYFSSAAYQGALGLDWREILRRNQEFAPLPDLVFIFDVDPSVGVARIGVRDGKANLFERTSDLAVIRGIFNQFEPPPLIEKLDATQSREVICDRILASFLRTLIEKCSRRSDWDMKAGI